MKFSLTKFEQFVITRHLFDQKSPGPEHGRRRLKAWEELKVEALADSLSGFGEIHVAEWKDKTTPVEVELTREVVTHLLACLKLEAAGGYADVVTRVHDRLEKTE